MSMTNKTDVAAALCCLVFIGVLAVAAYWDRSIRILHVFESLLYSLTAVLCLRHSTLGYALGMVAGAFWLWMAGFLTTFVRNGFERLDILVRTGSIDRPDILIAVPAAVSMTGLLLLSCAGYARLRGKSWRDVTLFAAAIVSVPVFFVVLFTVCAPQYLAMFKGVVNK
jgi:hypothetical protein